MSWDNSFYTQLTPNAALTGTAVETVLASILIPGGSIGANGTVEITAYLDTTNNANAKTLKTYLGSTNFHTAALASGASWRGIHHISNAGSQASQVFSPSHVGYGVLATGMSTASVDTSADQILYIKGTLGTITDTITLKYVSVLIRRGV